MHVVIVLTLAGSAGLLVAAGLETIISNSTAQAKADRHPSYKAGVCDGLRAAGSLDPSQPIDAKLLRSGTVARCGPIGLPRGLPPATREVQ